MGVQRIASHVVGSPSYDPTCFKRSGVVPIQLQCFNRFPYDSLGNWAEVGTKLSDLAYTLVLQAVDTWCTTRAHILALRAQKRAPLPRFPGYKATAELDKTCGPVD